MAGKAEQLKAGSYPATPQYQWDGLWLVINNKLLFHRHLVSSAHFHKTSHGTNNYDSNGIHWEWKNLFFSLGPTMVLNSSCLSLPNPGIAGMHHHLCLNLLLHWFPFQVISLRIERSRKHGRFLVCHDKLIKGTCSPSFHTLFLSNTRQILFKGGFLCTTMIWNTIVVMNACHKVNHSIRATLLCELNTEESCSNNRM